MKTLLNLLLCTLLFNSIVAQNTTANEQWTLLKTSVKKVDSLANQIKKQRTSITRKTSKIVLVAQDNSTIKHKIKIKYKKGNVIAKHIYIEGGGKKTKLLFINSELMLAKMRFEIFAQNVSVKNTFTRYDKNKWYWLHKGKSGWDKKRMYKKIEYTF